MKNEIKSRLKLIYISRNKIGNLYDGRPCELRIEHKGLKRKIEKERERTEKDARLLPPLVICNGERPIFCTLRISWGTPTHDRPGL